VSDIQDSYVKKLLGLAPDFRTTAHDFPEMAETARNMWVRGLILRQVGKMYAYDTTSDPDANGSQVWEKPALDAITYDDLLLIHAGDIFPFGGIRGAYKDNPFGYVEDEVSQILSPYVTTIHANVDAAGTTVTFTAMHDNTTYRANPMRYAGAGCKIRIFSTVGHPWVRINSVQWTPGSPGTITATIPVTDITGAAHGYTDVTATNKAYELTLLPDYDYGIARDTAGKFIQMYGQYTMFIGNKIPMCVWNGGTMMRPQRYGDSAATSDAMGAEGYYPHFKWLSVLNAWQANEYQAINSYASGLSSSVNYGNFHFGYGAYHSTGVSILRGANAACNFMEYALLGGTYEVLQPITTTEPDGADPEPYCQTFGTATVSFGTAVAWDINDYDIKKGDIFITPPYWRGAAGAGNAPTLAERLQWPDYSGGWGRDGEFYTIVSVDGENQTLTLDANHIASGADKKPFAILRKIGGNYVRWCNSKENGGFTNWNPSGDYDGNYREMGWGDGDIQDIKVFAGAAWVFKRDAIGRISYTGDWNVFRLDFVTDKIGTHGGFNSVVETPRGLFFPHGDDYYLFDGSLASLSQPAATGHRRIHGGWGNNDDIVTYSAAYDNYHNRVVMSSLTRGIYGGGYDTHGAIYSLDSGQWVEHTAHDTLSDYSYGHYPTLVRSFCTGLDPASGYDERSRENYILMAHSQSTGDAYSLAIYDWDDVAHPPAANALYWAELPMDVIDWKSMPFDMGFPNYVKELKRMRTQEETARSTTTIPTFWWNVAKSQDFCLGFTDAYATKQAAKGEPSATAVRFQAELIADGGQVLGNTDISANFLTIALDTKVALPFTVGVDNLLVEGVALYGKYNGGAGAELRFGIYSDTAGVPDALLNSVEISDGGGADAGLSYVERWHYRKFGAVLTLIAGTQYWFCLQAGTASVDVSYTAGVPVIDAIADPYGTLSDPYGVAGASTPDRQLSVFVQSAGNERGAGVGGLVLQWEKERLKTETR